MIATGTGATVIHMPAVNALWDTGYGRAILVKIALLCAAMTLAAVNLFRVRPALTLPDGRGDAVVGLLRRTVAGETVLLVAVVFAAAVLTSLAPPPPSFALQNSALARVGPGRVAATVHRAGYALEVLVAPNRAAAPDDFALRITKDGRPVTGADVTLAFNHLEMQMPEQQYQLRETQPGVYSRTAPALVMVGRWGLSFEITPPGATPFTALIVDQPNG